MRVGPALPSDIFTDNHRWGDVAAWNEAAAALHEEGGIHRVEREGFTPFWAVIDHAALIEIERQHEPFTNEPEPVLRTRLEAIEFDGTPTTSKTTFVGGHKTLPIRYTLRRADPPSHS